MRNTRSRTPAAGFRTANLGRTAAAAAFVLALLAPGRLAAQGVSTITGTVRDAAGQPLAGAAVLLLGTGERTITDSAGEFALDAGSRGPVLLIVRRSGYRPVRRVLRLPLDRPITLILRVPPSARESITAEAGTFRLGALPDAALSNVEMARTPGAAGDPFRAIQSLAGIQNVGDGAGLFVRGGGASETRVLVDGLTVMSPFRQESERTVSFGRFDPVHVRGIHFSTGGFSARYGDALSAVADFRMAGKPIRNGVRLTASVAGLSVDLSRELSETAGFRVSAGHTNAGPFLRMNGRREEFDEVPRSTDFSGAGEWIYRPGGSVKASAFIQSDRLGVFVDSPVFSGVYQSDAGSNLLTVSGRDDFGGVRLSWGMATSGARKDENFGRELSLNGSERLTQVRALMELPVSPGIAVAAGAEIEDRRLVLAGSLPVEVDLPRGPRTFWVDFRDTQSGTRLGGFGELELLPAGAVRLVLGLRGDRSSFTRHATVDPRVSASFRPTGHLSVTAAWGVFHQVPSPRLYGGRLGDPTLPPMSARHFIAGATWDDGDRLIRAEAYRKRYSSLAGQARDLRTKGGGGGVARGFDVLLKEELEFLGLTGRVAYSFIRSERTDLDTGELAPSPHDATHTLNVVANRTFGWLRMGAAYRVADGVPFTPVEGAVFNAERDLWRPVWGAPMSERLPGYSRLDLSASVILSLGRRNVTVFFLSMMNALDHRNIPGHRYNEDFSEEIPLESTLPRSIFFGVTTTLPF